MTILGISQTVHGSSAALVDAGGVISATVEERFTRQKYSAEFPLASMRYCLGEAGQSLTDVEGIAYFMNASNFLARTDRTQSERLRFYPEAYYGLPNYVLPQIDVEWVECVEQKFQLPDGRRVCFYYVDHHLCHAAEAFFLSPFEEAAILTLDGRGDGVSAMLAVGRGDKIIPLRRVPFPHSIGQVYSTFTEFLGFQPNSDEYKVMGLAAYGTPDRYYDRVLSLIRLQDDGTFEIDLSYFSFFVPRAHKFSDKFIATFGQPRGAVDPITPDHMDLAAAVQMVLEDVVVHVASVLYRLTGLPALCYGGGVALNSLVNGSLLRRTPFKNLAISSSPNDSGSCRGAALYVATQVLGRQVKRPCQHDYLGPEWPAESVLKFLDEAGLKYERVDDPAEVAAAEIAAGKVVGWFQGRMEFGPRALGNRSILADPRRAEMKDIVNSRVKFRERFRPFAPSVTAQGVERFFEVPTALLRVGAPLDFMLLVCPVREPMRGTIPAVTHVDGTARVQIVHAETNPAYHRLLDAFEALTGIPVVLNTSFNVKDEPMVCSPADALRTFAGSGLDALFIDHFYLSK